MKLAIMQPYLFPYIGYWQLINAADVFVILDDVNYIKRGWINRNRILAPGGEQLLTLPVEHASQNSLICDMSFSEDKRGRDRFVNAVKRTYKGFPGSGAVENIIDGCFAFGSSDLTDFIRHQLFEVMAYLGIGTSVVKASELRPRLHGKAQEGILELCGIFGADTYVNPIGGTELYSREAFAEKGIRLYFLKTDFEAVEARLGAKGDLSILDVIARADAGTIGEMLKDYELI
ncbi:MAG: WbqC family protein [Clostridia bacterium]|nr:WbqC family protein [Clostridia bacterium]